MCCLRSPATRFCFDTLPTDLFATGASGHSLALDRAICLVALHVLLPVLLTVSRHRRIYTPHLSSRGFSIQEEQRDQDVLHWDWVASPS